MIWWWPKAATLCYDFDRRLVEWQHAGLLTPEQPVRFRPIADGYKKGRERNALGLLPGF